MMANELRGHFMSLLKIMLVGYIIGFLACFGWLDIPYAYATDSASEVIATATSNDETTESDEDELVEIVEESEDSLQLPEADEAEEVGLDIENIDYSAAVTSLDEEDVSVNAYDASGVNSVALSDDVDEELGFYAAVSGQTYDAFLGNDGKYYLYLPSGSVVANTSFNYQGAVSFGYGVQVDRTAKTFSLTKSGSYSFESGGVSGTLIVEVSNLPTISFSLNGTSLSTINAGSKDIKYANNSLYVGDASGASVLVDNKVELKGRGNFSWTVPKRGYQFKLSSKANLFGMGKAKTWILIANYGDASLLRNSLAFSLAQSLSMPYTSNYQYVDMWVDGEYQGVYMLCEKVQVGDNRIELDDPYGVVVELDDNYYAEEDQWFRSSYSNGVFVLKDSVADGGSNEVPAFSSFRESLTAFEKELYGNKDWNKISSMIDVDSFIDWYFVEELSENADAVRSSMFMYKDGMSDTIHLGPVWDFDLAFGNCNVEAYGGLTNVDYVMNASQYSSYSISWFKELFAIPEFCDAVETRYNDVIKSKIAKVSSTLDSNYALLSKSAEINFKRWDLLGSENAFGSYRGHAYLDTYAGEVSYLKNWLSKRVSYLNSRYTDFFTVPTLSYSTHVQNIGWLSSVSDGAISGTSGRSLRMEALKIDTPTGYDTDSIQVSAHVQNIGWQDWVDSGQIAGTSGQSKRVEAVRIRLNGLLSEKFDVYYRVHVQNQGWMGWAKNGEAAGTQGMSLRIEAIQIKLVAKGMHVDVGANAFLGTITYSSHVQNIGWQTRVSESMLTGTSGRSLRMEALKIELNPVTTQGLTGTIRYRAHVQNIGWQNWVTSGQVAGTSGRSLRIEALQIELTGQLAETYDVVYRVHVQNVGWTGWVKNGEIAGTTGRGLRMEALEIKLVRK